MNSSDFKSPGHLSSVSASAEAKPSKSGGNSAASGPGAPPPGKRRWFVFSLAIFASVVGLVVGGLWISYRHQHVVIGQATVRGQLHRIGARIEGQVRAIEVIPGQRVAQDDVLIRLQDDHIQATAGQVQAELQAVSKRFEVEQLAIDHERHRLTFEVERCEMMMRVAAGELEAARSTQALLERDADRANALSISGVTSGSEIDRIKTDRDNARARARSAEGNLAVAEVNCRTARVQLDGLRVREAGLEVISAEIERTRQALALTEADLQATIIRAPEDAWVVETMVMPGGSAKVGEPIMLVWVGAPWIEAWADESHLTDISLGSAVDISLPAFPNRKLRGSVEAIGVLADKELQALPVPSTVHSLFPKAAKIPIRIAVSAGPLRLQPGLTAMVGIERSAPSKEPMVGRSWAELLARLNPFLSSTLHKTLVTAK